MKVHMKTRAEPYMRGLQVYWAKVTCSQLTALLLLCNTEHTDTTQSLQLTYYDIKQQCLCVNIHKSLLPRIS